MNGPFALFKWQAAFADWSVFAGGLAQTAIISALALALALVLGIIFGALGSAKWLGLRVLSRVYVELIQNTPLVIQIFFIYHGLPHIGLTLDVFLVGVLGIGMYHGAYIAEVFRAGIGAVPKGQTEAAVSQGFSWFATMRHIVLPQAWPIALPPLTNQAIFLIKKTSVLAMVAGGELMYHTDSWSSGNMNYGPAYIIAGLLYLALCLPLSRLARRMEKSKVGQA